MLVQIPEMLSKLGVDLKPTRERRGEIWSPCPLPNHQETQASWSIKNDLSSPKHGHWYCFGCKEEGGPVALVSSIIGITTTSARQWLIDNDLVIGNQTPDAIPARVRCLVQQAFETELELPRGVITDKPFREWPQVIRRYLVGRGITASQVSRYGIGYSVGGEQNGRVIFPVRNQYGALLYYTGRSFARSALRYRSADEQPGARPTAALFGEVAWRYRDPETLYMAEGAIKVLAVERATCRLGSGETGAAIGAFSGSEIHSEQVAKIRRFNRLVYVADPNPTGLGFAEKIKGLLGSSLDVRVVVPPGDNEADTLTRRELRALLGMEE